MAVSKAKEQQLKILGCTINFVQVGQGRRNLLLLPGWLGTWRSDFEGILDGFDHEEFTMVAWDPPGYGKSTVEGYRRCIPHECKLDAAKAHKLMKQLGLLPFSVLGWSEGGVTALHIAHKAPNTVSKVIIWGAPSYVTKEEVALSERRTQLNVFSPETKSRLITEYGEAELEDMLKRTVQLNRWLNEVLNDYDGNICRDILPEITQPTLVLHGKRDWIVDKLHGEYVAALIPNARLELHDTAQHALHIEEQYWFVNKVITFLCE